MGRAPLSVNFQLWDPLKLPKWWLAPIIVMLFLLCLLILFTQASAIANFTEEVVFKSDDLRLRGTLLIPQQGPRALIVLCHGNRKQGRNHRLYRTLAQLLSRRYAVLSFDFRGFGESDKPFGNQYESLDFSNDIARAVEFLRSRFGVPPKEIILLGHSLGALQVLNAARSLPVSLVIAVGPSDVHKENLAEAKQDYYVNKIRRHTGVILQKSNLAQAVEALKLENIFSDCLSKRLHLIFGGSEHAARDVEKYLEDFKRRCHDMTPVLTTIIVGTNHMYDTESKGLHKVIDRVKGLFFGNSAVHSLATEIKRIIEESFQSGTVDKGVAQIGN